MAAIEANVASRGARIAYRHPVTRPWRDDAAALAAIDSADLVLVNGEGTMHHGKLPAARLAELGPYCAARGKPAFLINATIQANRPSQMRDIAAFAGIWVRESRSAEELGQAGVAAAICGDLSFCHDLPRHDGGSERGLVLDSASPNVTTELLNVATALKADFVTMRHNKTGMKAYKKGLLRRRHLTGKPLLVMPGILTFGDFGAYLARRHFLVTGRFHGLCFALNSRVPFLALPLDTWKSEGVLSDIGLNPARMFRPGATPAPFSPRELEQISAYLADIRSRIAAMFDRILPT